MTQSLNHLIKLHNCKNNRVTMQCKYTGGFNPDLPLEIIIYKLQSANLTVC